MTSTAPTGILFVMPDGKPNKTSIPVPFSTRQAKYLATLTWRSAKRLVIFVIGTTILLIGLAMIVLPGPAVLIIPLGLIILATEFTWAKWLLRQVRFRNNKHGPSTPQPPRNITH